MLGDLTKRGREATASEIERLIGCRPDGAPRGLSRCPQCGEYRGECLDPSPQFTWLIVRVCCRCENDNLCARCGERLHSRRLNADYFDERDGHIWHVPGFCAMSHRCSDERRGEE